MNIQFCTACSYSCNHSIILLSCTFSICYNKVAWLAHLLATFPYTLTLCYLNELNLHSLLLVSLFFTFCYLNELHLGHVASPDNVFTVSLPLLIVEIADFSAECFLVPWMNRVHYLTSYHLVSKENCTNEEEPNYY